MGEPDANVARQTVLLDERAQLLGETVGVDDLTVDDEADWQWVDDGLAHTTTVGAARWQRYDGVGTDVEGDGRGGPARSETDASAGRQVGNPHVPLIGHFKQAKESSAPDWTHGRCVQQVSPAECPVVHAGPPGSTFGLSPPPRAKAHRRRTTDARHRTTPTARDQGRRGPADHVQTQLPGREPVTKCIPAAHAATLQRRPTRPR